MTEREYRLSLVNRTPGRREILTPQEYLQRGGNVLSMCTSATSSVPRNEIYYPHWSIRYVNRGGRHNMPDAGSLSNGGMASIFADLALNIDHMSMWSEFNFYSKTEASKGFRSYNCVANIVVSAHTGTILMLNAKAEADLEIEAPGQDTPRLYNSELMYQAWRDSCAANSVAGAGDLKNLKYIIVAPIHNEGTNQTIEDVLLERHIADSFGSVTDGEDDLIELFMKSGYFPEVPLEVKERDTIPATDANPDHFRMLMGTANGRPVARMCADHADSLGGKQVGKVHAWNGMPMNDGCKALVFELA